MRLAVLALLAIAAFAQTKIAADQQPKYQSSQTGFVYLVSPAGIITLAVLDPATLEVNWQAQPPVLRSKPQGAIPEMFDSVEANGTWSMPQGCSLLIVFRGLIQKPGLDYSIGAISAGDQRVTFTYPVSASDPVRMLCFR